MLGFGEREGREKEKREERQSFFLRLCFCILRFLSGFRNGFSLLFFFFSFTFFFNTVLTWKIVGASKVSVIYIYRLVIDPCFTQFFFLIYSFINIISRLIIKKKGILYLKENIIIIKRLLICEKYS